MQIDMHLEKGEWDAAIQLAEKDAWYGNYLEKVADAVIPYRPDWVIRAAPKQADALIAKTQSNLYPAAAQWLGRAKKAYQHKGRWPNGMRISPTCVLRTPVVHRCKRQLPTYRGSPMPYEPFHERFGEFALKETRSLTFFKDPRLAGDEFTFFEAYCNDENCDCRRVFFNVLS